MYSILLFETLLNQKLTRFNISIRKKVYQVLIFKK